MPLAPEQRIEIYRRILLIRHFEQSMAKQASQGHIPGSVHASIGQEAAIVGACYALRPDDFMSGTHRSHGHPIAKGAELGPLFAELMGKKTGICKGKGGSMHLADFKVGCIGESGIVGGGLPLATGAGLSAQARGTDQVTVCFFGDGASNQGTFHESINMAAVWKLPVIYFCENNKYAATTPAKDSLSVENIADRAVGYGIPGVVVDGQDALAVYEAMSEAVDRARRGDGPTLIEAKTYRYGEHAEGLFIPVVYRPEEEVEAWKQRDPVPLHRNQLIEEGTLSEKEAEAIEAAIREEVEAALAFAKASPFPDASEAYDDVFGPESASA